MKAKKCGYCGSINEPEAQRCLRCGIKIASAVVSDDYESEEILSFGNRSVSTPSPGPEPVGGNPTSGGVPAEGVRGGLDAPGVKHGTAAPATRPAPGAGPVEAPRLLTRGARLLAWLLLAATLGGGAFTAKRFGYSGDPEAGLAALLSLSSWDLYWIGIAVGASLIGLLAFVALHLAASILENLVGLRGELHAMGETDPDLSASPAQPLASHPEPEPPEVSDEAPPARPRRAEPVSDAGAQESTEADADSEPPILVEQLSSESPRKEATLEPGLVEVGESDKRKEPTFDD